MTWIDVSVPLAENATAWPGRPGVRLVRDEEHSPLAHVHNTALSMDVHVGTHLDTPAHVSRDARRLDEPSLAACIGPATVVDASGEAVITRAFVEKLRFGERVLFRTHEGALWDDRPRFHDDFIALDESAARHLVDRGVKLVGIDYASIQSRKASVETHLVLLEAGIVVLEGLDLRSAAPGQYDLLCLPLRIPGCDGLPARAILAPPGTIQSRGN